jgi:hypothetical protein
VGKRGDGILRTTWQGRYSQLIDGDTIWDLLVPMERAWCIILNTCLKLDASWCHVAYLLKGNQSEERED